MKLTNEQREQMWQENTLTMLRYNLENGTQTISNEEVVTLIDDIQRLRSSEQAWKEEASRLTKERDSHAPEGRNYTNAQYVALRSQLADKDKVVQFARNIIQAALDGGHYDGGEIQDMAVKLGLLEEVAFDPGKHGDNFDFEPGDPYFIFTNVLKGDTKDASKDA